MRGVNDDEILDFVRLTYKKPFHVRFIEMTSVGGKVAWTSERFLSIEEILETIQRLGTIRRIHAVSLRGSDQRYALEGARGEVRLIGVMRHSFCEPCNRALPVRGRSFAELHFL